MPSSFVDSDYVLHGAKKFKSERPEYLTNSQITTTSKDLTIHLSRPMESSSGSRIRGRTRTRSPGSRSDSRTPSESPSAGRTSQMKSNNLTREKLQGGNNRLQRSVSFERESWRPSDGEDSFDDEDDIELQQLAYHDAYSSAHRDVGSDDWIAKSINLTNSLSPRELRNTARASSRQSKRSSSPQGSCSWHEPILPSSSDHYPITEIDKLARQHFPVTASAYRLEFNEPPTSNSMAMSPPPRHLRASKPHKWRVDGTVNHMTSTRTQTYSRTATHMHPVDKMYSMAAEAPSISASTVHIVSPFQTELSHLRMERLRIEEEHLLEMKRQAELERIRGPRPKWYESKTPDFHYEAHKNNELLANEGRWQQLLDYRHDLKADSQFYHMLNN